jgi:hypothetical protein
MNNRLEVVHERSAGREHNYYKQTTQSLVTEHVDATYAVQDCVLEFIYQKFGVIVHDESDPDSVWQINDRINWKELSKGQYRFANTDYEATFGFNRQRHRVTRIKDHCSIWKEVHRVIRV